MYKYIALLGIALPSSAFATCPVETGQTVEFESVEDFISEANSLEAKGEFETTDQYQERLTQFGSKLGSSVIFENTLERYRLLSYNADKERFEVYPDTFGASTGGWSLSVNDKYAKIPEGVKVGHGRFDVSIKQLDSHISSYSIGGYSGVTRMSSDEVVIYDDRKIKTGKPHWKTDGKVPFGGDRDWKTEVIFIDVPLSEAEDMKDNFRWGLAFKPKAPYYFSSNFSKQPTLSAPTRVSNGYKTIPAKIFCSFVTDKDGKVLRVVLPRK